MERAEFLELILQDELVVRHTKAASFRDQKSLDDSDFEFNTSINKKVIYELAAGSFIRQARDSILIGPPGVGKIHIAHSIGRQLRDAYGKGVE